LKAVWRFHKKLKTELQYDLVILLLDIHPKEGKVKIQYRHLYTDAYDSTVTIAKLWKQPRCPTTDE
jgi:hypothetical protein